MYSANQHTTSGESKTLVAQTKCYELLYNLSKNRIYLTINGFWKSRGIVSSFIPDLKKALQLTQPGFTLLADLRSMITHPQSVMALHIEGMTLIRQAGIRKGANIAPADHIATLQVEDTITQSHLPLRRFTSYSEAETWLDNE